MSSKRIAIRYATPLLQLAEEQSVLDKVSDDIKGFLALHHSNRDFQLMLLSPIIPHLKKASILKTLFTGKVEPLTLRFFEMVARKTRENLLSEIAEEFVRMYNEHKGLQEATVTTAFVLDPALKASFEKLVKDISGKEPLLNEKVNPALIGGYTLQMGDRKLDDSVSGQLQALKLKFSKEKN